MLKVSVTESAGTMSFKLLVILNLPLGWCQIWNDHIGSRNTQLIKQDLTYDTLGKYRHKPITIEMVNREHAITLVLNLFHVHKV